MEPPILNPYAIKTEDTAQGTHTQLLPGLREDQSDKISDLQVNPETFMIIKYSAFVHFGFFL